MSVSLSKGHDVERDMEEVIDGDGEVGLPIELADFSKSCKHLKAGCLCRQRRTQCYSKDDSLNFNISLMTYL
jgi:hypothetical protein